MLKIMRKQGDGIWIGNHLLMVESLNQSVAELSIRTLNKKPQYLRIFTKLTSPFYLYEDVYFEIEHGWNKGQQIRLCIEAPDEIHILRDELMTEEDPRSKLFHDDEKA